MVPRSLPVAFLLLVVSIVFLPLLTWPFAGESTATNENRRFQQSPDITAFIRSAVRKEGGSPRSVVHGILRYRVAFTDYFEDRFPMRPTLVAINHWLKSQVLRVDPLPEKVFSNNNGWFFLGNEFGDIVDEAAGLKRFSPVEVHRLDSIINSFAQGCKAHGIMYRVAIVPDKNSACAVEYPLSERAGPSDLDLTMALSTTDLPIVDLSSSFHTYRSKGTRLYHRTDSHWNQFGAFLGYTALVASLDNDYVRASTFTLKDFVVDTVQGEGGDLTGMLGLNTQEDRVRLSFNAREEAVLVSPTLTKSSTSSDPERFEIRYRNPRREMKILLFRDSFSDELGRYLKEQFGETVLILDHRFDMDLVLAEKPDIVVSQIAERSIDEFLRVNMLTGTQRD